MKKQQHDSIEDYPEDWEPDWLNPANDRKTPYTEEELNEFAQGFIESLSDTDAVKMLIQKEGIKNATEIIKAQLKRNDKYNLDNIDSDASSH